MIESEQYVENTGKSSINITIPVPLHLAPPRRGPIDLPELMGIHEELPGELPRKGFANLDVAAQCKSNVEQPLKYLLYRLDKAVKKTTRIQSNCRHRILMACEIRTEMQAVLADACKSEAVFDQVK